ncbi:hypothetical protein E2986_04067 [Frieseomelitta varia]|uniref:UDENN FNIP1/2-type domain-containing protein n=1 Tax=Frieseomelitta varia TaxID=561572 RepID=A0A833RXG9_9HYME|nr:hypothetical protein E2986_04067 [Frieseomelitta varia]
MYVQFIIQTPRYALGQVTCGFCYSASANGAEGNSSLIPSRWRENGVKRERMAEEDISLLSEMVFGTVAMTYRGSSFKIHSMNSPSCIMCTKVFPATEHNVCKQQK